MFKILSFLKLNFFYIVCEIEKSAAEIPKFWEFYETIDDWSQFSPQDWG